MHLHGAVVPRPGRHARRARRLLAQPRPPGTPFATTPDDVAFSGATYSKTSLAEGIARYVDGAGSYSPPIIHLNGYSANGHYVMIIGQISATEYRVLDPAVKSIYSMTLTNGSTVHYFKGSERVTEAVQYYYPVHHWSAWTAIETDDGAVNMERTCVDCGKTETARIPDPASVTNTVPAACLTICRQRAAGCTRALTIACSSVL